jgi:hypothetical protein
MHARAEEELEDLKEEMDELKEEFQKRLGESDRAMEVLKDEKIKLQELLQASKASCSSAEAKVADLQSQLERFRCVGEVGGRPLLSLVDLSLPRKPPCLPRSTWLTFTFSLSPSHPPCLPGQDGWRRALQEEWGAGGSQPEAAHLGEGAGGREGPAAGESTLFEMLYRKMEGDYAVGKVALNMHYGTIYLINSLALHLSAQARSKALEGQLLELQDKTERAAQHAQAQVGRWRLGVKKRAGGASGFRRGSVVPRGLE